MSHLQDLNAEQLAAVRHRGAPLLVLAGAGSGKTRVITRRIASLALDDGIPLENILAVTFTNKAAGEMRERVRRDTGVYSRWISTFHSSCVRILRAYGAPIGVHSDFSIYDSDDQKKMMRRALAATELDPTAFRIGDVLGEVRRAKTAGITPEQYVEQALDWRREGISRVYTIYQGLLAEANALDFDDLLMAAVRLLETEAGVRAHLHELFQAILVDEFQDTNAVQYRLLRLLEGGRGNVTVTGDPDQSIYSWRGADIGNILAFTVDHPDAVTVRLEQNYRSTKTILAAADAVIVNNTRRLEKNMWTENDEGLPVEVIRTTDERSEARRVLRAVEELLASGDTQPQDIAVFFRTNAQSRAFEEAFATARVPHVVVGAFPFYERAEVKDVLAYLKLLINGRDVVAFERAITSPRRKVGARALETLRARALEHHGGDMLLALQDDATFASLRGAARKGAREFAALMSTLQRLPEFPTRPLVEHVLEETGLLAALESTDELERAQHIGELVSAMAEYDRQEVEGSLAGFLEGTALASLVEEELDDEELARGGRVSLMTVHAAKGLEFDNVFVTGLEEGLFPLHRMDDAGGDDEEERRLFYVALTRARRRVTLSLCSTRSRHGKKEWRSPSSFFHELPGEVFATTYESDPGAARDDEDCDLDPFQGGSTLAPPDETRVEYDLDELELAPGDLVEHPQHGRGEVMDIRQGFSIKVVISFEKLGERLVDLRYCDLKKISPF